MKTRRAVLMKKNCEDFYCEVGCLEEGDNRPFDHVIRIDELYERVEWADKHDDKGRICGYRYVPHYEI